MKILQIFATVVGLVSFAIGLLRFFIDSLASTIPPSDGIIHIISGTGFVLGVWTLKGRYVRTGNLFWGAFYKVFGMIGMNWPHIILGVISLVLSLAIKTKQKSLIHK
jgi:hypothetical protein